MAKQQSLVAASVITEICEDLKYSRAHVAKVLRDNRKRVGASQRGRFWHIPQWGVPLLRQIVVKESGMRYKLGETGPHR